MVKYAKKPLDVKLRIQEYRKIYIAMRKLKLSHIQTVSIIEDSIIPTLSLNFESIDDKNINKDYSWHRCHLCDGVLKINKITGNKYCTRKTCIEFLKVID